MTTESEQKRTPVVAGKFFVIKCLPNPSGIQQLQFAL